MVQPACGELVCSVEQVMTMMMWTMTIKIDFIKDNKAKNRQWKSMRQYGQSQCIVEIMILVYCRWWSSTVTLPTQTSTQSAEQAKKGLRSSQHLWNN